MQKVKYMGIVLLSFLIICCDGDDKGGVPGGRTYTKTVNVAAEASQLTVTLKKLNAEISNIGQSESWVVATKEAYISGSPSILLEVSTNTSNQEREAKITITDVNYNVVILKVKQEKAGETPIDSGIDAIHNETTDQPAYSRPSD